MIPQRIEQVLAPALADDPEVTKDAGNRLSLFSLSNRSPSPTLSQPNRRASPFPPDLIAHSFGSSAPTYSWCGDDIEFKVSLEWKNLHSENQLAERTSEPALEPRAWTVERFVEVMLPKENDNKNVQSQGCRYLQWIMLTSFLLSRADCPPQRPEMPSLLDLEAIQGSQNPSVQAYAGLHSKRMRSTYKTAMSNWLPHPEEAASARRDLTSKTQGSEQSQHLAWNANGKPRTVKAKYSDAFSKMHGSSNGNGHTNGHANGHSHVNGDANNSASVGSLSPSKPPLPPRSPSHGSVRMIKLAPVQANIEIASGYDFLEAVAGSRRPSTDSGHRGIPGSRRASSDSAQRGSQPMSPEVQSSFIPEKIATLVPELQE